MSAGGSDIGEEIRRMNELSRQNSIQSSHHGDISVVRPNAWERMESRRSSRASSYSRADAPMRWRGYSPNEYVTSPIESTSGSWSNASFNRHTSGSKSSRLAQVTEPVLEGRPLDSPLRTTFESEPFTTAEDRDQGATRSSFDDRYDEIAEQIEESLQHVPPSPTKERSVSKAGQQSEQDREAKADEPIDRPRSTDTYREAQIAFQDFDGVHFSPDTDEIVEINESGEEVRRVSARASNGRMSMEALSLLRAPGDERTPRHVSSSAVPAEGMVYYPAPVPRLLNLPKRMSQLPAANMQAKRRSQMLHGVTQEAKVGAPWLSQEQLEVTGNEQPARPRASSGPLPRSTHDKRISALPPQLRASVFFEHQPIQQNVDVQGGSAVATLDSILAASATAPATAFTDHPFAGDVRNSVYTTEYVGKKTTPSSPENEKKKKRRSSGSSLGRLLQRRSSSDQVTKQLNRRDSQGSMLTDLNIGDSPRDQQKRENRSSQGNFEREDNAVVLNTPGDEASEPKMRTGLIADAHNAVSDSQRRGSVSSSRRQSIARPADPKRSESNADQEEGDEEEHIGDNELMFVPPSTLLAELQVRKAQQKSRSKTAATSFPRGMHSTLLQLDAVDEINKRKRKNQRIALAWEDPHQRALEADIDEEDQDVPLGVLYPSKNNGPNRTAADGRDFDRPLGLMERRQLEDNEPLSRRRDRLRGGSPLRAARPVQGQRLGAQPNGSQMHLGMQPDGPEVEEEVDDAEDETLTQAMRRSKVKVALDTAISDVALKDGERPRSTFTDDVMSQFGGPANKDNAEGTRPKSQGSPAPANEDETLGQRRARLQREREAEEGEKSNVETISKRPQAKANNSYANLLANHPTGHRQTSKNYEPVQGSLLHVNAQTQAKQKSQLMNTNMQSSSWFQDTPGMTQQPQTSHLPQRLGQRQNKAVRSSSHNNVLSVISPQTYTPTSGLSAPNSYFAYPNAGMPDNSYSGPVYPQKQYQQPIYYQQPVYYQQQQQQQFYNPTMMGSGFMGNGYIPNMNNFVGSNTYAAYAQGTSGAGNGMTGLTDEQISNNQRSAIDQWRMGIAPR